METEITITITAEEYMVLSKCVDGKVDNYERSIAKAKRNRKYNPQGLFARRLTTLTGIQKKLA